MWWTRSARSAAYGMDVDGSAFLVCGDAGEGQPAVIGKARLHEADRGGEARADVDDEPVPQLGGVRMPQHVAGVVVAVDAQRLAPQLNLRAGTGGHALNTWPPAVACGFSDPTRLGPFP